MRGTGKSTQQIKSAPLRAIYVVPDGSRLYFSKLTTFLCRSDLRIESAHWVATGGPRGLRLPIVIDHEVTVTTVMQAHLPPTGVITYKQPSRKYGKSISDRIFKGT